MNKQTVNQTSQLNILLDTSKIYAEQTSKIFGETEEQITKEFKSFKMAKLFKKLDYAIIDNKLLYDDFIKKCNLAIENNLYSVTVLPNFVPLALKCASNSQVKVNALISYPYGEDNLKSKLANVKSAVTYGADGVIITLSSMLIKNNEYRLILKELSKINRVSRKRKVYALIDTSIIPSNNLENLYKVISKENLVYAIVPMNNLKITSEEDITLAVKSVEDKCVVAGGGNIENFENMISLISKGANMVSSTNMLEIANVLKQKIQ